MAQRRTWQCSRVDNRKRQSDSAGVTGSSTIIPVNNRVNCCLKYYSWLLQRTWRLRTRSHSVPCAGISTFIALCPGESWNCPSLFFHGLSSRSTSPPTEDVPPAGFGPTSPAQGMSQYVPTQILRSTSLLGVNRWCVVCSTNIISIYTALGELLGGGPDARQKALVIQQNVLTRPLVFQRKKTR